MSSFIEETLVRVIRTPGTKVTRMEPTSTDDNTTSTNPTSTDRIQHATLVATSWKISLKHGRHLLLQLLPTTGGPPLPAATRATDQLIAGRGDRPQPLRPATSVSTPLLALMLPAMLLQSLTLARRPAFHLLHPPNLPCSSCWLWLQRRPAGFLHHFSHLVALPRRH